LHKLSKGIYQGSIIGPLICNVIIKASLYSEDVNSQLCIFSGLSNNFDVIINNRKVCRKIHRHLIDYVDDLAVTTTFKGEIFQIYFNIKNQLLLFGLELSSAKTSFISFYSEDTYKKKSFNYLGFTFLFVPIIKIKKGGILTRNDDITARKFKKDEEGSFLTYPSNKKFKNIKDSLINIIEKLKRLSMVEVLNEINPVIRGFVNYFG